MIKEKNQSHCRLITHKEVSNQQIKDSSLVWAKIMGTPTNSIRMKEEESVLKLAIILEIIHDKYIL